MIRTAAFIALAASAASFQPMSSRPAFVGHRALHMSNKQEPYYGSYKSNTLERPTVQEENVVDTHPPAMERQEMTTDPVEQLETKKAPKKTTPAKGGHGKDGVFSPMVLFVKGIMGDQLLDCAIGNQTMIAIDKTIGGNDGIDKRSDRLCNSLTVASETQYQRAFALEIVGRSPDVFFSILKSEEHRHAANQTHQ